MLRCLPPCKGNHTPAQGDALGNRRKLYELQALKGRHNRSTRRCLDSSSRTWSVSCARDVSPLQGSDVMVGFSVPRALPWADLFRPLRGKIQNSATPKRASDGPNPTRRRPNEPNARDDPNPTRATVRTQRARGASSPTRPPRTEPNTPATERTQRARGCRRRGKETLLHRRLPEFCQWGGPPCPPVFGQDASLLKNASGPCRWRLLSGTPVFAAHGAGAFLGAL